MISDKQPIAQCAVYNGHVKEVGKKCQRKCMELKNLFHTAIIFLTVTLLIHCVQSPACVSILAVQQQPYLIKTILYFKQHRGSLSGQKSVHKGSAMDK